MPRSGDAVVTVVIPTRGSGRGLRRAVASALGQREVGVRLIVAVDGPPQDPDDAALLAAMRPPHTVVQLPRIGRVAALRNLALDLATTDLVAFLDDDDWWMDDKLRLQLDALRRSAAVLLGCNALRVTSAGPASLYHPSLPESVGLPQLLRTNWLITSSVVADAGVLRSVGGFPVDAAFDHCEDYKAWLRMAAVGRVRVMPQPLVYYNADNQNSLSRSYDLPAQEARRRVLCDFAAWSARTGRSLRRRDRLLLARLTAATPSAAG